MFGQPYINPAYEKQAPFRKFFKKFNNMSKQHTVTELKGQKTKQKSVTEQYNPYQIKITVSLRT